MSDKVELKTINKITGEIFTTEVNPYDPDSLGECLIDIQSTKKNLEKLEADVKSIMFEYMQSNGLRTYAMKNGYDWRLIEGQRKNYSVTAVLNNIDQDMLISTGALSVSSGKLEKLMADMIREGSIDANANAEILESIEMTPIKPHVKLEKVK